MWRKIEITLNVIASIVSVEYAAGAYLDGNILYACGGVLAAMVFASYAIYIAVIEGK